MLQRYWVAGCVALAWWLAMPVAAYCQIGDVPPVEFTGPISHPRYDDSNGLVLGCGSVQFKQVVIYSTRERRIAVFAGANADGPLCRCLGEVFLGATPVGVFCASLDMQASADSSGPGASLSWCPWEGVQHSFRLDLLRMRITANTIVAP